MKKRILYVGNKSGVGNATTTSIDTLGKRLEVEGFSVITTSSKKNKAWRLMDMLHTVYTHRNEVDMVLIDTYSTLNFKYATAVGSLCRRFNIPYIPILHGGNLPARLKKSPKASAKLFKNAWVNVAPSFYLFDAFKKEGFTNCTHIPNTIAIENYPFKHREKVSAKLLWVRSFSEIYNPHLALDILRCLISEGVKATLTMVGPEKDGSKKSCMQYSKHHSLPVTFTGKLKKQDWIAISKEHDIFINTTNVDNMPISIIEAMALGLPVISTNVGGLSYLIENNKSGMLVAPRKTGPFIAAIKDLISTNKKATTLSRNGRSSSERFDWHSVKDIWISLLTD